MHSDKKRGFRREIRRDGKYGTTKSAIAHPPVWPVAWNGSAVHIPAEPPSATSKSISLISIEGEDMESPISSSFNSSGKKPSKWLHNKESRSNTQKLPGKALRGKQRWRRMGIVDDFDFAAGLPIHEYMDDSTDFFGYESDLSSTLHLIHLESGGSMSPKALSPKLFKDHLGMRNGNSDSTSSVSSGGSGSESGEWTEEFAVLSDDDSSLDALAAPIPLRKTRSTVNKNLTAMAETLFCTIFPEGEAAGSGMTRTKASSSLAWDAADDSDEDQDSTVSDETFMIQGADGEGWIVPHIPKIEQVPRSWFHEQISNHANSYYKGSVDSDPLLTQINPLLSDMTTEEMISCLVNARLVLSMLEHLRGEDVRFTSPRLRVLQGLYRFGNGNGSTSEGTHPVHPVREIITRCLHEVIAHHTYTMQNTVQSMRDNCLDSSMSNKAGLQSLYMHYATDRGYPQLLELLEFAVLCENREVMLLYQEQSKQRRGSGGKDVNQIPAPAPLFSPNANEEKLAQERIETRLHSLLCATCVALKALTDDEFFDHSPKEENNQRNGQLESETANMLLNLQLVILTLAKCVHIECSYRLSTWLMRCLVRTWPCGEQCNPGQVYVRAVDIALRYAPPAAVLAPSPRSPAPPLIASPSAQTTPMVKTPPANAASPPTTLPSSSDMPFLAFSNMVRRPLVEQCISKLVQAVRSHHTKVAQIALQVVASPALRVLLLQQEKSCYERADARSQAGSKTSTAETSATFTGDSVSSNKEEDSLLVQLVCVLRQHRDCHWHPHVRSLSACLLDELTDMMFNDSIDDDFDM